MGYHDTITQGPDCRTSLGGDLRVSWVSSSPPGTSFQVYVDRRLAWSGQVRSCHLPHPQGPTAVDVVAVDPGSERVDYSGGFAVLPTRFAALRWTGGLYLSRSLLGFRVYASLAPGGPVSYATPVAQIPWAPRGIPQDGFGVGGFGAGGFGFSAVLYQWTSGPLGPGAWGFGIVAYDAGGLAGPASEAVATIAGPPRQPAARRGGPRVSLALDPATRVPTLTWLPSPA